MKNVISQRQQKDPKLFPTLQKELNAVLKAYNRVSVYRGKTVSDAMRVKRAQVLDNSMKILKMQGFKLQKLHNFKAKHMIALVKYWQSEKLAETTIITRLSIFRTFCEWIGKPGLLERNQELAKLIKPIKRGYKAKEDKTWTTEQYEHVIKAIHNENPIIAVQLMLQMEFGLRINEACLYRPHQADKGWHLEILWGTKGRRTRELVLVDTEEKRWLVDYAKTFVTKIDGTLIPKKYTLIQWRKHVYYICSKHGVSKTAMGITFHGLRRSFACRLYNEITGIEAPVKGGDIDRISPALDNLARHEVSESLGHSRIQITDAYIGSSSDARKAKI